MNGKYEKWAYFIVEDVWDTSGSAQRKVICRYRMKGDCEMSRKLIIDGNAVYELDEKCMLKKKLENVQVEKNQMEERKRSQENLNEYKRMLRIRQG